MLSEWGEAYTHYSTTLTLVNAKIESETIVLDLKEFSKLYYAKINGGEPEYTAWKALRQFVYKRSGEAWELVSQALIDEGPAPINEPTGVTEIQMRNALSGLEFKDKNTIRKIRNKISYQTQDEHSGIDFSLQGTFTRSIS